MKPFLVIAAVLLHLGLTQPANSQSSLPQCGGDDPTVYHNCVGSYVSEEGGRYVGEMQNGLADGKGIYKWPNGDIYVGSFFKGTMHGHGKLRFFDGTVFKGEFSSNHFLGESEKPKLASTDEFPKSM